MDPARQVRVKPMLGEGRRRAEKRAEAPSLSAASRVRTLGSRRAGGSRPRPEKHGSGPPGVVGFLSSPLSLPRPLGVVGFLGSPLSLPSRTRRTPCAPLCAGSVCPQAEGARLRPGTEGVACAVPFARTAPRKRVTRWSLQRNHGGQAREAPASTWLLTTGTRGCCPRRLPEAVARGHPRFAHVTAGPRGLSDPPVTCLPTPSFPSLLKGAHISLGVLFLGSLGRTVATRSPVWSCPGHFEQLIPCSVSPGFPP